MIKFSEWEENNFKKFSHEPGVTVIFPSREIYFSPRLLGMMRFENSNAPKTMDQWLELCSPSDHAKISELENIIYKSDEIFFSLPRALYCGDGIYRNFRLDAFIQRDGDGTPLRLSGNEISSLNAWLDAADDGDRVELNGKILEASRLAGTMLINDVTKIEDLGRENLILRHEISRRIFAPFPKPLKSLMDSGREDFIFDAVSENLDAALKILPGNSKLNSLRNSLNSRSLNIAVMGLAGSGKTFLANALADAHVINENVNLIDAKGWDSLDGNDDLKKILPEFDFVIYVIPVRSRLKSPDHELLRELNSLGSKMVFFLSKTDLEKADTEAGKIIKSPGQKISDDIEALKNEIKNFNDDSAVIIPGIEAVIGIIKDLSGNSSLRALVMRAARALKIMESERNVPDSIIKNLRNLINENKELNELKIPENKFDFDSAFAEKAEKNGNILSSLIISMREHGFKGRFFSLGAFNGHRRAVLFSAQRNMAMKLFARLSHNLALEKLGIEDADAWLGTDKNASMPFECVKINSAALAPDEKILIAPPDYLLKKEDFDGGKFKKILKDYVPAVCADLARLESGLSDLIHAPYLNAFAKSKWVLAFPDAALLKDGSGIGIDELKDGIKNFCGTNGIKAPEFFIFENYEVEG